MFKIKILQYNAITRFTRDGGMILFALHYPTVQEHRTRAIPPAARSPLGSFPSAPYTIAAAPLEYAILGFYPPRSFFF